MAHAFALPSLPIVAALVHVAGAYPGSTSWKLPQGGDWFAVANWTAGVPGPSTNASFGAAPSPAGAPPLVVTAARPAAAHVLEVVTQRVQFGDGAVPFQLSAFELHVAPGEADLVLSPNATLTVSAASLGGASVRFRIDGEAAGMIAAGAAALRDARLAIEFGAEGPPPVGSAIPILTGAAACMTDFDVTWSEPLDAALVVAGDTLTLRRFAGPLPLESPAIAIAAPGLSRELVTYASIDGADVDISGQVTLASLSPETIAIDGRRVIALALGVGTVAVTLGNAMTVAAVTVGDPANYPFERVLPGLRTAPDVDAVDVSANGRFVVLATETALVPSDVNGVRDVYHVDLLSGAIRPVSDGAGVPSGTIGSFAPRLSADGRVVAFWSAEAAVLARAGGGCEECPLVVELVTGNVEFAGGSVDEHVPQAYTGDVHLSADGRYVAYGSQAGTEIFRESLVQTKVRDRLTGNVEFAGQSPVGDGWYSFPLDLSGDGRFVLSYGVGEGLPGYGLLVRDRLRGSSTFVAEDEPLRMDQPYAAISDDGRYVGVVNVPDPKTTTLLPRRYDVETGEILVVGVPFGWDPPAAVAAMSADGRHLLFPSYIESPGPCGADVDVGLLRFDAVTGTVETLGVRPDGVGPVPTSAPFALSADGGAAVYRDLSGDLAPNGIPGELVLQRFGSALQPDLDGDGVVGPRDLGVILGFWGTGDPVSDLDGDGRVGAGDLSRLFASWNP
jgi:hypothetical protein